MNLTNKQFNVSVNFLDIKADHMKYKKYIQMKIIMGNLIYISLARNT